MPRYYNNQVQIGRMVETILPKTSEALFFQSFFQFIYFFEFQSLNYKKGHFLYIIIIIFTRNNRYHNNYVKGLIFIT